jgi:alkylation response protein AidB-like acyl-CoA dehydrogenase
MTSISSDGHDLLDVARSLAPLIREHATQGEKECRLPAPIADAFTTTGIFRMCRPKEFGGLEVDPITAIHVVEELSRADGSSGWCAMICGVGGAFDAFLPPEGGKEMYAVPEAVTTGVIAPTGRALPVDGGYRVTGRWSMASACQHSAWLGGAAVVFDGDAPRMGPGGMPATIVAMLPASDCRILETWDVSGLRGSGSQDFEVDGAFVPDRRSICMPMLAPHSPGALFTFPLLGFLATGIASVALGIGRSAVDELVRLAKVKTPFGMMSSLSTRPTTHIAAATAEAELSAGRAFLLEAVRDVWASAQARQPMTLEQRARLRLAATTATLGAVRAVDLAYTTGGSTSLYSSSLLQRGFRDVHTITQHFAVAPHTHELLGRVLLGLTADAPMV